MADFTFYYNSESGDDLNDGLTELTAIKTVSRLYQLLEATGLMTITSTETTTTISFPYYAGSVRQVDIIIKGVIVLKSLYLFGNVFYSGEPYYNTFGTAGASLNFKALNDGSIPLVLFECASGTTVITGNFAIWDNGLRGWGVSFKNLRVVALIETPTAPAHIVVGLKASSSPIPSPSVSNNMAFYNCSIRGIAFERFVGSNNYLTTILTGLYNCNVQTANPPSYLYPLHHEKCAFGLTTNLGPYGLLQSSSDIRAGIGAFLPPNPLNPDSLPGDLIPVNQWIAITAAGFDNAVIPTDPTEGIRVENGGIAAIARSPVIDYKVSVTFSTIGVRAFERPDLNNYISGFFVRASETPFDAMAESTEVPWVGWVIPDDNPSISGRYIQFQIILRAG